MARLSKLFSRGDKEKEALAESEKNRNRPASSSSSPPTPPPEYAAENALPPPDLTAGFRNLSLEHESEFPASHQCIAHLKLLECFYRLRQKIGSSDGLFGIKDSAVTDGQPPDSDAAVLLAKLAEKRWAIYVARAADRFGAWSRRAAPSTGMPTITELEAAGEIGSLPEPSHMHQLIAEKGIPPLEIDANNTPPVDVLMVLHAYMLNPRACFEDAIRNGKLQLWHAGFPWRAAVDCINSETFAFEAPEQAQAAFVALTQRSWDNVGDPAGKFYICPKCDRECAAPWTTCSNTPLALGGLAAKEASQEVDRMLASGEGYCERDFRDRCKHCNAAINHEYLKVGKFCADVLRLVQHQVPMSGTILGTRGIPWKIDDTTDRTMARSFKNVNRLIQTGMAGMLDETFKGHPDKTMQDVKALVQRTVDDRKLRSNNIFGTAAVLTRADRVTVRRMMSRYWENSSPYALDLVGAVIRQCTFTEKMHTIDWLHSPALHSTMARLLVKYQRFLKIMAANTLHMAVPTLDVDLAWHTHQLSPHSYCRHTVRHVRQFVDHDDKVAEPKLNDAFAWTAKTYRRLYAEPYSDCTCWYCEAVRESLASPASRLFLSTRASHAQSSSSPPQPHPSPQDPRRSVHISTHNAVRPTDDPRYTASAGAKASRLETAYAHACDRAAVKGRPPPKRDDYYWSDAYGYPVYMPAYAPYAGPLPYTPAFYPGAPGCMALAAGAAGNCCTGTCGSAVAAGGCGGNCGGGAACGGGGVGGACGGGGAGGGGCGGGGGGGGGGCGGGGGGC